MDGQQDRWMEPAVCTWWMWNLWKLKESLCTRDTTVVEHNPRLQKNLSDCGGAEQ